MLKRNYCSNNRKKAFDENDATNDNDVSYNANSDYDATDIGLYAQLLLPFYDSNEALPKFYNKLLQSLDTSLANKNGCNAYPAW